MVVHDSNELDWLKNGKISDIDTPERKLLMLMRSVDLTISSIRKNELKPLGTTPERMGVLHFTYISAKPPTISHLRKVLYRNNSSTVEILNRMERDGLILRKIYSKNKKYTRIYLTNKGLDLYKKAIKLNSFSYLASSLNKEQQKQFESCLIILREASENYLKKQLKKEM
jgi:DNA-binding MarR family transcriptional regulator